LPECMSISVSAQIQANKPVESLIYSTTTQPVSTPV
jgi:hypothetical protein